MTAQNTFKIVKRTLLLCNLAIRLIDSRETFSLETDTFVVNHSSDILSVRDSNAVEVCSGDKGFNPEAVGFDSL